MSITITFAPNGRGKAKCKLDENFPDGKLIEFSKIIIVIKLCSLIQHQNVECGY